MNRCGLLSSVRASVCANVCVTANDSIDQITDASANAYDDANAIVTANVIADD
jgi:hypothetical protein